MLKVKQSVSFSRELKMGFFTGGYKWRAKQSIIEKIRAHGGIALKYIYKLYILYIYISPK